MSRRSGSSFGPILILSIIVVSVHAGCGRSGSAATKSSGWTGAGPGTDTRHRIGLANEPSIRVLLMEAVTELAVAISGPYQVRQNHRVLAQGPNLRKIRITTVQGTPPRVMIGQLACPNGPIEIVPRTPGTLRLYFKRPQRKEFSRRYNGYARIFARSTPPRSDGPNLTANSGSINVVNVVVLERYLPSVLQAELYPNWHLETYRAQAIAARTYALYQMQTSSGKHDYDVRATEASQVYKGIEVRVENPNARRAARDTRGIVCTWASPLGDKIFSTYYSSACGGMTQDAANCFNTPSIPPLAGGVKCTYCNIGGRVYRWEPVRLKKEAATQLFLARFPEHSKIGTIQAIEVVNATSDGRPLNLKIRGENGHTVTVNSYEFRLAMGGHRILSNHCQIVDLGSTFEFRSGRGFGHGVGMCQWGAEGQARLGRKVSEILTYYYPKSRLKRAY